MTENDETPADFLARLGRELKAREGVDGDLAEVVSKHLLTALPTEDCVELALAAITAIASERANPRKDDANG